LIRAATVELLAGVSFPPNTSPVRMFDFGLTRSELGLVIIYCSRQARFGQRGCMSSSSRILVSASSTNSSFVRCVTLPLTIHVRVVSTQAI
jgi:hypothetical protein